MKRVFAVVALTGCASGSSTLGQDDAAVIDAKRIDAVEVFSDGAIDARLDAPLDAFVPDAPPDACVPVATELLVNPALDLGPVGTGWQQMPIDALSPLVTGDDGVAEHSAPYKAWLGGIEADTVTVTDVLYQDVVVPANTTQLVLTGVYEVRTSESATAVYDTASIALTQTNGTPIATVRSLSNLTPTTTWTAINHTFTQTVAGQTVRLRMTSSNDFLNATSFYFDTLSLRATHCP